MADKRRVRKSIKQLQRVKTWQLLILLILMSFIAATFLRLDNIGMDRRREAVLTADKAGNETTIESRLYDLQRYSATHMNSSTGPFYLEGAYRREAQRRVDTAKTYTNPNGNIYAKAEGVCKPQFTVWSEAYVQCFADQLAKYPASPNPDANVTLPDVNLFRYSYDSPLWAPNFAGWSVVGCIVLLLMIAARLVSLGVLRLLLKRHYRGI
ncbi:MAG TPA: hypothetical protein VL481_02870 [Verrucomicrobiae bacterium]|nr:hypothetical protein [Verrucomicrobiae bacterium]